MKHSIFCKTTAKGEQSFYLRSDAKTYYLFTQNYRASVKQHYAGGVSVNRALDYSSGIGKSVRKTMEKLRAYIPYVEKEYGICVLDKTQKKHTKKKTAKRSPRDDNAWDLYE